MLNLILEQPLILWSIVLSVLLFAAALGIGAYHRTAAKRSQRLRAEAAAKARAEEIESYAQQQGQAVPQAKPEPAASEPEIKEGEESTAEEEAADEPEVEEEDGMLAEMFEEEIIIDPKYQALLDRLDEIEMQDLQRLGEEIYQKL